MNVIQPLAVAAMSLAMLVPAKAAEPTIPAEYRGVWCTTEGHPYLTQLNKIPAADCLSKTTLTATTIQDDTDGPACRLKKIKSVVVDRVNLPEGRFTCPGGKEIPFTFTTGSGSMGYKARRLYLEDGNK